MYVLIFTRLTGSDEEAIFLKGTYETYEEARESMQKCILFHEDRGFNREWWRIEKWQAYLGAPDNHDIIRYHIFDTEHPVGHVNNRLDDWDFIVHGDED